MDIFKRQIDEDISFIKKNYLNLDPNLSKDEYAFNFWILAKIYNIDEELAINSITEYKDMGIDCFVHYPDSKELFIIQNKYWNENSSLPNKEMSYFLTVPLTELKSNCYKKSIELQSIFNRAFTNKEYKIWLHFFITSEKNDSRIQKIIDEFNKKPKESLCEIRAKIFNYNDLKKLYYGETFKNDVKFDFTLKSINKGTVLQIKPEDYKLPDMSEAYYLMTPVIDLYHMYEKSKNKEYPLFEENIREYLGRSNINTGIINTLRDKTERRNFFYFNNGITILCRNIQKTTTPMTLTLTQPQIVNGCQTVNTIHEVLSSYTEDELIKEFSGVYVMTKVLVEKNINKNFYRNVVKFTNSQNSINEKAFASSNQTFLSKQNEFKSKGYLLLVKPSDKNTYSIEYKEKYDKNNILSKANKFCEKNSLNFSNLSDIYIPLDKLLQVLLAFIKDGYYAYTKKNLVLDPMNEEIFENISLNMFKHLTINNLIRLFLLYRKSEIDKKQSKDKKTPIPYYLIGFLGYFIKDKNVDSLNITIENLYESKHFEHIYDYLKALTNLYKENYNNEYNVMIKKTIDLDLLKQQIKTLKTIGNFSEAEEFFSKLN